jgi:hypothetical protein
MAYLGEQTLTEFADHLRSQYCIYERMLALCEEESALIAADGIDALRASLSRKHALLDEILRIEEAMKEGKAHWAQWKDMVAPDVKQEVVAILDAFKMLMEKLVDAQKKNEAMLYEKNMKRAQDLTTVRQAKCLHRAYSTYGDSSPAARFMDKIK